MIATILTYIFLITFVSVSAWLIGGDATCNINPSNARSIYIKTSNERKY